MKEIFNPPLSIFRTYMPDIAAFVEDKAKPGESVICDGKISHTGTSPNLPQLEYMKKILPKERWGDVKMTLPAPEWYHMRYREGEAYPKEVYSNDEEYFGDISKAYRQELKILYDAGLRNVQIDDPNFACKSYACPFCCHGTVVEGFWYKCDADTNPDFCSDPMLEGWKKDPLNKYSTDQLLQAYIKFYNDCIAEAPKDMHIGLHICRGKLLACFLYYLVSRMQALTKLGNFVNSRHFSEGGYDAIAQILFNQLNVSTFYLEYDTPRAGTFAPLKHLPKNKKAILGVITSKFPELEDKGEMVARVREGAKLVAQGNGVSESEAVKQLGVSPQCGFASHSGGNLLGYEDMLKKLALVRGIADEVWPGEA